MHPQTRNKDSLQERKRSPKDGPFVYRLGRKIFILERGVRFPHGLKAAATAMYPGITKLLDKLAKTNVIHKNKANNLKSKLAIYINKLA